MTNFLPTRWIALPAVVLAVLVVAGFVIQAQGQPVRPTRIAVVVDTSKGPAPAVVDRADAALRAVEAAAGAEGQLRVTRTPTEQLSVTHYLAAEGYDAIVGVDLDRAIAIDPVAARYPHTRLMSIAPAELEGAVTAAAAAAR
jgi:hypothetical protein